MTSTDSSEANTIQSFQNDARSRVTLVIRHQFPGVELISPDHAGNGVTCHLSSDQNVDVDSTVEAYFNVDLFGESLSVF
jgi:hypothetical protein